MIESPLTPTENNILRQLRDGRPHTKEELLGCLFSNGYRRNNLLYVHVCNLRRKLPFIMPGYVIGTERLGSTLYYKLTRLSPLDS